MRFFHPPDLHEIIPSDEYPNHFQEVFIMSKKRLHRILGGAIAAACAASAIPVQLMTAHAADEGEIIYATDFEDGVVEGFTGRGGAEVLEVTDEQSVSGDKALTVSGREESWNGPQFRLDEVCKPNTEYLISANVKSEWYSQVNFSMEYTDTEGERHYSNLKSQGTDQWVSFEDVKISFTPDMTNVYVYFECGDTCKLYVDDFELKAAPIIPIQDDLPSLSSLYSKYFKFGTAIMASNLSSPSFMDLVDKHFSASMTFGNELKPDFVLNQAASLAYVEETGEDDNPQISLAAAKSMLDYCAANGIPVRGHTLVWHSQTPDWFFKEGFSNDGDWVSKEKMITRMDNYIKNVMETLAKDYPDVEFYAWDVVNEAWTDSGSPRTAGSSKSNPEESAWVKVFGDNSFIRYAFESARKYAPKDCKLYYNDFNEYIDGKMNAIYDMAMELKADGLIDGIGMQAHLDVGFPTAAQFERAIEKYASTGLDVQVTELDITTPDTSENGLKTQAQMYSDILDACVKHADSISAVIIWGVTDDQSWRAEKVPLLFDGEFQAKPAFYSITDGMEVPVYATGDLNMDGKVSVNDVVLLQKYLLTLKKFSAQQMKLADMTRDGKVNAFDLTMMKKRVLASQS